MNPLYRETIDKFTIGDKVILNPCCPHYHRRSHYADCLGKLGTVASVNSYGYIIEFDDGDDISGMNDSELIKGDATTLKLLYGVTK